MSDLSLEQLQSRLDAIGRELSRSGTARPSPKVRRSPKAKRAAKAKAKRSPRRRSPQAQPQPKLRLSAKQQADLKAAAKKLKKALAESRRELKRL